MNDNSITYGLTFDDLLLIPAHSRILPLEVDVSTRVSRNIALSIPLVSAAMDTVTEADTAITIARQGGLGFIHKNMPIEKQVLEVEKVKKSESGMIVDPITIGPTRKISEVLEIMERYRISGVPVVDDGNLLGIITNRDLRFENNLDQPVSAVMTKENLATAKMGITLEESKAILHKRRIEKLLVVDEEGKLRGLITIKDIEKIKKYPNACKDTLGRLRVGAGIGVGQDMRERLEALVAASVDVVVLDTAHGHSQGVLDTVTYIKKNYAHIDVVGGNIATPEACEALVKAGADAVKVGIGPGSICTTRIIAGVGVPQLTAVMNTAAKAKELGVPVIADGGLKYSGDMAKALAGGAHTVMVGSLLAGTEESPGEIIYSEGQTYKYYRGMGSIAAMKKGGKERYAQSNVADDKLVPEGIEGKILLKGKLAGEIFQLCGGIRSAMGYSGAKDIAEFQAKAQMVQITGAGLRESHPHDVGILKDAPNYRGYV